MCNPYNIHIYILAKPCLKIDCMTLTVPILYIRAIAVKSLALIFRCLAICSERKRKNRRETLSNRGVVLVRI